MEPSQPSKRTRIPSEDMRLEAMRLERTPMPLAPPSPRHPWLRSRRLRHPLLQRRRIHLVQGMLLRLVGEMRSEEMRLGEMRLEPSLPSKPTRIPSEETRLGRPPKPQLARKERKRQRLKRPSPRCKPS